MTGLFRTNDGEVYYDVTAEGACLYTDTGSFCSTFAIVQEDNDDWAGSTWESYSLSGTFSLIAFIFSIVLFFLVAGATGLKVGSVLDAGKRKLMFLGGAGVGGLAALLSMIGWIFIVSAWTNPKGSSCSDGNDCSMADRAAEEEAPFASGLGVGFLSNPRIHHPCRHRRAVRGRRDAGGGGGGRKGGGCGLRTSGPHSHSMGRFSRSGVKTLAQARASMHSTMRSLAGHRALSSVRWAPPRTLYSFNQISMGPRRLEGGRPRRRAGRRGRCGRAARGSPAEEVVASAEGGVSPSVRWRSTSPRSLRMSMWASRMRI